MLGGVPNYGSSINAQQTLGSGAGRTYLPVIQNPYGAILVAVHVNFTTTATVGNRNLAMRVLDSAGNRIFSSPASTVTPASQTQEICFGAGAPNVALVAIITSPLPIELPIPPGAQVQVYDGNNIDPNDQIAVNITYKF